jgi:hypothetical protein
MSMNVAGQQIDNYMGSIFDSVPASVEGSLALIGDDW